MFGHNADDVPGLPGEQVFEHIMDTLYGLGEPGQMILPGVIYAACDLAKQERLDYLAAGALSPKTQKRTTAAYDNVGRKILAMFNGAYAGSTFASNDDGAHQSAAPPVAVSPEAPCPDSIRGPNRAPHVSMQSGDGPISCYYCLAELASAN